jgi:hypothetical protein
VNVSSGVMNGPSVEAIGESIRVRRCPPRSRMLRAGGPFRQSEWAGIDPRSALRAQEQTRMAC